MQKYIIINARPILFPMEIIHADLLTISLNVESAGFFVIVKDPQNGGWKVVVMGESTTLGIHSRPDVDPQIIKTFLKL